MTRAKITVLSFLGMGTCGSFMCGTEQNCKSVDYVSLPFCEIVFGPNTKGQYATNMEGYFWITGLSSICLIDNWWYILLIFIFIKQWYIYIFTSVRERLMLLAPNAFIINNFIYWAYSSFYVCPFILPPSPILCSVL